MTFSDGSQKCVKTTLNPNILSEYGVSARKHHIFNIEKGEFIPIREDAINFEVLAEKPTFKSEVNTFANRFI